MHICSDYMKQHLTTQLPFFGVQQTLTLSAHTFAICNCLKKNLHSVEEWPDYQMSWLSLSSDSR